MSTVTLDGFDGPHAIPDRWRAPKRCSRDARIDGPAQYPLSAAPTRVPEVLFML